MPNKKALDYIVEKTKELIGAPTCCDEAKAAAQAWLDAVGTENQAAETERYFAELEEDIMPIGKSHRLFRFRRRQRIFRRGSSGRRHRRPCKRDSEKRCQIL